MASEAKRGLARIASNYARLGTTVILGIILVPVLIRGVGKEGYGLYALLGSTVGFAQMFREIIRYSMNRELGHAYHTPGRASFAGVYNSAMVVCLGLACASALVFLTLFLCLPLLQVSPALMGAAGWMILANAVNTFVVVVLGPQFNMYMVTERMASWNFRTALERIGYTSVAVVLFEIVRIEDPARGLMLFSIISNAVSLVVYLVAVWNIMRLEPCLRPDPSRVTWASMRAVLATGGWNIMTTTAMNLHLRVDQIIVNVMVGATAAAALAANAAFGLGVTLTSYVRMVTVGMTDGLDTVAARLSAKENDGAVRTLLSYSTLLHAWVALPAGVVAGVLTRPILELWVARRAESAADLVPLGVGLVQALVVGMTARAITDNWTRVLYGAGHVRRYARQFLLGGLANPIVSVALIWALPEEQEVLGPAIAYSAIFVVVHFLWLPAIASKCLGVPYWSLFAPIVRPAILAAVCSPILIGAERLIDRWTLAHLVGVVGVYSVAYVGLSWVFVLTASDRARVVRVVMRRGGPGRANEAPRAERSASTPPPGDPIPASAPSANKPE